MIYVMCILATMTLVGALLVVRGWRGRKVNDHPICGRCGFDLIGRVTAQLGVGAEICPECGADLLVQGMVQHGLKERRKVLIAAGAVLLLASVLGWPALVFGRLSNVNWNTYKPAWVLEQEAVRGNRPDDGVLRELMARRALGGIDSEAYRRLAEHAMTRQMDLSLGWSPAWGDLIEDARLRDEVSPELYRQYRVNGLDIELVLRDRVREDEDIPYELTIKAGRVDSRVGLSVAAGKATVIVEGDAGEQFTGETKGGGSMTGWGGGRASMGSRLRVRGVPPGKRKVTAAFDVHICQPGSSTPIVTKTVMTSRVVEFVGSGEPVVTKTANPMLLPAIRNSLRNIQVVNDLSSAGGQLRLEVDFEDAPVDMSFMVSAVRKRADGKVDEWPLPPIVIRKGGGSDTNFTKALTSLDQGKVSIVFKASTVELLRSGVVTDVWDGELTIHDVDVAVIR